MTTTPHRLGGQAGRKLEAFKEIGRREQSLSQPRTLGFDARTCVEHVAVEDQALLQIPDLRGHHLSNVHASLELGHDPESVQIELLLALDDLVDVEEDANAVCVFDATLLCPREDGFISDVLVDLTSVVEHWPGNIPEELVDQVVISLVAQFFRERRRGLEVEKHEDAGLAARPVVFAQQVAQQHPGTADDRVVGRRR